METPVIRALQIGTEYDTQCYSVEAIKETPVIQALQIGTVASVK